VKTFVASSLHFVAFFNGYTCKKCNEAGFWRPLTYEETRCSPATNTPEKIAFVAVSKTFRCRPLQVSLQPFFCFKWVEAKPTSRGNQRENSTCFPSAEPWSIYTRDELQLLVAQNRVAPPSPQELAKIQQLKKTLGARITIK
jgi:hypothetical protein